MIRWYADNSELNGIWQADIPDTLILGGVAVPNDSERSLIEIILDIKSRYCNPPDFPIKWNMKDLKRRFAETGRMDLFERLLLDSKSWRLEILDRISSLDFTILVCVRVIFGTSKGEITRLKNEVIEMIFTDGLARFGMLVKDSQHSGGEVILDWPDGGDPRPYFDIYSAALWRDQGFYCGPLKNIAFSDNLNFTKMESSNLLQLSDLVVGSSREFVEYGLGKKERKPFGLQALRLVAHKIRGWPNQVLARGLYIPKGTMRDKISEKLPELHLPVNDDDV